MEINELIQSKFDEMSKGQKKVATYVTDHPKEIALSSAQEIGTKIGVSETTVIRFCYSLSLTGYAELQKIIREQLLFHESSYTLYQKSKLELEQEPHFYEKVMERDRKNISETIKQIKEEDFESAIERLSKAETIYILGLRSSYGAASWLSLTLGLVKGNVRQLRPESEDIIQVISQMNEKSVVIVISFHRYTKETIQIAKLAHTQKAFVIGITDSLLAPIHSYSNLLFSIYSPNKSTIDAVTPLFSLMNAIVAGLSVKEKKFFDERHAQYKTVRSDFFFEEGVD
ncbi:MurR/RpiR family transcriptional regulator [Psychrobacillus sp.]|uniref:MurR/RpiR family transcriptional regulator n=1 Tax=Psychrobacillus sp. TaxID=1871623 RepID=UPI0028BE41BC|nr:MurR/RpiR family transcriptional regulator [Psychrobacillus sp.]